MLSEDKIDAALATLRCANLGEVADVLRRVCLERNEAAATATEYRDFVELDALLLQSTARMLEAMANYQGEAASRFWTPRGERDRGPALSDGV